MPQRTVCDVTLSGTHVVGGGHDGQTVPAATGHVRSGGARGPRAHDHSGRFFLILTLFKLILNLTLFFFFFKTNTFDRDYYYSTTKSLCRAMHGGAADG